MTNDGIKLAYIVLAHSDPMLFERLMRRLSDPRAAAFVHVDGKVDVTPFKRLTRDLGNVHFVDARIKVMWAGFSQVESTILTLKAALENTDERCTHFVVISGADYPLAGNEEIIGFFQKHKDKQFVRRFLVMDSNDKRQEWRIKGRHFRELADRFTWKRKPLYAIEQFLHLFPKPLPPGLRVALGSNWVAITREFARYCVDRSAVDKDLINAFKSAFGPDEMFIHTLVENSPFVNQADPVETYTDITKIGGPFHYGNVHKLVPNVPIVTEEAARKIIESRDGKLFTRKFSSRVSAEALNYIDWYTLTEERA